MFSRLLRCALVAGALFPVAPAVAAPPTPMVGSTPVPEGFRLEPRPALDDVFGDVDSYRKTIDRFVALAADMQQRRDLFAAAVEEVLARLMPLSNSPHASRERPRACPEADVAVPYARALKLGQDYLHSGRELTRHFEEIRELDRLGETLGLTPDYRQKVKRSLGQYQALLTDYREMKVAFHDQLADELKYAHCDLDKLLARAGASNPEEGAWPSPGQPGAPGVLASAPAVPIETAPTAPGRVVHEQPGDVALDTNRSGIFIFVDNSKCPTAMHVQLDGKALADVPPASRSAYQTTPGPHDLCLVADGSPRKCGDAGTVRRSYLHEGWTIALRCN